jgi:hypothetical protein
LIVTDKPVGIVKAKLPSRGHVHGAS